MQKPEQQEQDGRKDTETTMDEEDDMEGMDGKAKALVNLLKTSSVGSPLELQTCRDR